MNATRTLRLVLLLCVSMAVSLRAAEKAGAVGQVELRGRIVCLAEEMHEKFSVDLPTRHEHLLGFKTVSGQYYTLLRTKNSEALFADQDLKQRDLILKGNTYPGSQLFESMTVRSIKNGLTYEVYYWCDICAIQMNAPGICDCCQAPNRRVEKPLVAKSLLSK